MADATCAVDGCERPKASRGYCPAHYERWKKTGDPGTALIRPRASRSGMAARDGGLCSVEGCDRPEVCKGYCKGHYGRWLSAGDPGPVGFRPSPRKYNGEPCAVDGCDRRASNRDFCGSHYARWRKHGDPGAAEFAPRGMYSPTCTVEGCDREWATLGMCAAHYARFRAHGDHGPAEIKNVRYSDGETCSVECCNRRPTGAGLCNAHYLRSTKGQDLDTPIKYVNKLGSLCEFDGCENIAEGRNYCPTHKAQHRSGKQLTRIKPKSDPTRRDEHGRKWCPACQTWIPEHGFFPSKRTPDLLHPSCRRCRRNREIMKRFGITVEEYDKMLTAQGGGCGICGKTPKQNKKLLAVDHNHACCPSTTTCGKCIRGLLCSTCNMILGIIGDKPSVIVNMARYLHMTEGRLL